MYVWHVRVRREIDFSSKSGIWQGHHSPRQPNAEPRNHCFLVSYICCMQSPTRWTARRASRNLQLQHFSACFNMMHQLLLLYSRYIYKIMSYTLYHMYNIYNTYIYIYIWTTARDCKRHPWHFTLVSFYLQEMYGHVGKGVVRPAGTLPCWGCMGVL